MNQDDEVRLDDSALEIRIKIAFQDHQIPSILQGPLLELMGKRFEIVSQEDSLWADRGDHGSIIGHTQLQERLYPAIRDAARELATSGDFRQYEALRTSGILL